jgi:hypothetical protein
MALWSQGLKSPCYQYPEIDWDWSGALWRRPAWFKGLYMESWTAISLKKTWFYEPGNDLLCLFVTVAVFYSQLQSHKISRYDFSPQTGDLVREVVISTIFPAVGPWSTMFACLGSYGKIYSTSASKAGVYETHWESLSPVGWFSGDYPLWYVILPTVWPPQAVVNREDDYCLAVSGNQLYTFRDLSGAPTLTRRTILSNAPGYVCYESRESLWYVDKVGLMGKYAYQAGRWEGQASVQRETVAATNYMVAFDTLRKRLAVFRDVPDDPATGACRCEIEFYRPLVRVGRETGATGGLTDPVPVTPLRAGQRARFVAHLVGEAGEPLPPYLVQGSLADPAEGYLVNRTAAGNRLGVVEFLYQAPALGGNEETLELSTTITDGE